MPLTAEDAAKQLYEEIKKRGKFNMGNVLDAVVGIVGNNTDELQKMLDKLLTKKGVLTADDAAAVEELLKKQEQERKKRQQIRTKNALLIVGISASVITALYFIVRKK